MGFPEPKPSTIDHRPSTIGDLVSEKSVETPVVVIGLTPDQVAAQLAPFGDTVIVNIPGILGHPDHYEGAKSPQDFFLRENLAGLTELIVNNLRGRLSETDEENVDRQIEDLKDRCLQPQSSVSYADEVKAAGDILRSITGPGLKELFLLCPFPYKETLGKQVSGVVQIQRDLTRAMGKGRVHFVNFPDSRYIPDAFGELVPPITPYEGAIRLVDSGTIQTGTNVINFNN